MEWTSSLWGEGPTDETSGGETVGLSHITFLLFTHERNLCLTGCKTTVTLAHDRALPFSLEEIPHTNAIAVGGNLTLMLTAL